MTVTQIWNYHTSPPTICQLGLAIVRILGHLCSGLQVLSCLIVVFTYCKSWVPFLLYSLVHLLVRAFTLSCWLTFLFRCPKFLTCSCICWVALVHTFVLFSLLFLLCSHLLPLFLAAGSHNSVGSHPLSHFSPFVVYILYL